MTILASPGSYLVWSDEQDVSDARQFSALFPEVAAEMWAEWRDRYTAEYAIVSGHKATVTVRDHDRNEWKFVVSGESMPTYFARSP